MEGGLLGGGVASTKTSMHGDRRGYERRTRGQEGKREADRR